MGSNFNLSFKEILEKEDIQDYDNPIWEMSKYQLLRRFSAESSGKPVASRIIKNIIWQVYTWICEGKHDLIMGNIRSFWYMRVKAPLGRVGLLDEPTDHYRTLSKLFSELVRDYSLFQYKDFGFIDENWENRRIGVQNTPIIVFSEKNGFFYHLKELHEEFDITVASLGGQPSVLSTEYMVKHMLTNADMDQIFYAYSIVDFDPSGWLIERNFQNLLMDLGLKEVKVKTMVLPSLYTEDEIELYKYPLSNKSSAQTVNENWLEATGGLNGELYGIEADSIPKDRLVNALKEEVIKFINPNQ